MNTLQRYLTEQQIKPATFAADLKMSRGALADLLSGRRTPSLALATRISAATRGAVPMEAWLRDEKEHAPSHGDVRNLRKGAAA